MKYNSTLNKDSLLILLFGIIIFTIGLNPEFISFQTRFALFAREMLQNGLSFFPTTYQGPYPDYPAMSTIIIYLTSLPFNKVTTFSAILPTAITSSLILVIIYRIGALQNKKWGFYAVLFALFTQYFIQESRSISLDQYTSLATALCFYVAYSATIYQKEKRLWFIPLILIGGFAFRGPVGLVIPTGVLCVYYLYIRDFKKLIIISGSALLLLALCVLGLFAAAYFQGGTDFVKQVFSMEIFRRISATQKNYFYYWFDSFISYSISYPIAIIVIISQLKKIISPKNINHKLLGCLTCWLVIVLLGMSIPGAKKARYLLPIVPAISLLAAYIFIEVSQKGILFWTKKIFLVLCYILPYLIVLLASFVLLFQKHFQLNISSSCLSTIYLMLALIALTLWLIKKASKTTKNIILMTTAVLSFIAIHVLIVNPICYNLESTRPFVAKVEQLQKQTPGKIVFYKIGPDNEDIKFIVNSTKLIKPSFVQSEDKLIEYSASAYFITKQNTFDKLSSKIKTRVKLLAKGKVGHKNCVVFIHLYSHPITKFLR